MFLNFKNKSIKELNNIHPNIKLSFCLSSAHYTINILTLIILGHNYQQVTVAKVSQNYQQNVIFQTMNKFPKPITFH
jgi:hypothetical protein